MTEFTGFKYEDLEIGQSHETVHEITADDIQRFAEVSGDFNPLHMSDEYAATTMFEKRIAHGALTASYISTVIGTKMPGPGCIYVGQNLKFKAPVKAGDTVVARVTIMETFPDKNFVKLQTQCLVGEKVVLDGDATIMVPSRKS